MLSHSYWQNRYGGDASAIGQSITIDGRDHEVVGVMPRDFHLLASDPQIYTPFAVDPARLYLGNFSFRSLARMRDGVTIEQAQGELARLLTLAPERYPGGMSLEQLQQAQAAPLLRPLRDDVVGDVGSLLWLVFGGVGVILLIACANVANLFLVRAESRERELAVRSALGAGRRQISGQFLTESILLGLGGGVFGTGLAYAGLRLLAVLVPEDLPRAAEITIDPTVLFFTVVLSILAGMFFGVFPMLRYRRTDHVVALKEGGRGAGASRARHRTRNGLVVAQMALALVLLIGSGLMIRSFQSLRQVNPGFQTPERILAFGIAIPETEIADVETLAIQYEQIAQRVEQVPGVTSVGLTTSITMDGRGGFDPLWVQDAPVAEGQMPPLQRFKWIGPGYFETMQNPLVAGRQLDWTDVRNRLPVAMVSEAIARQYWGDAATAIGRQIATGGEPGNWREIIGVVGDVHDDGVALAPVSIVYWPMAMTNPFAEVLEGEVMVPRRLEFVVRSDRVGTAQLLTDVREAVWSINSNLPLANPRSLDVDLRASMARTSFTLVMLAIAAAMALLLGAVGVYGVISYVVSQRTREIGLRVVLGAESRSVRKMVLRQGLRLAAVGVFVGLIAGAAVTRLMSGVLYGVSPLDPLTYGLVALILTAIALLASYLPARRASRVSPMDAIRAE
jgi:predicted permease